MKHEQNILFLNDLFGKKYSINNVIRIFMYIKDLSDNVCFFRIQAQISDGWNKSREQKYTGRTVITKYWVYFE